MVVWEAGGERVHIYMQKFFTSLMATHNVSINELNATLILDDY